jgi:hypothetical protein
MDILTFFGGTSMVKLIKKKEQKHFIDDIIKSTYPHQFDELSNAPLIQYLKHKTKSVGRGSKSRGSFANHYAIYVLVEDYVKKGYTDKRKDYSKYEGADFTPLFNRQRELPFGAKLQNHALNHRLNEEFEKYHDITPIIRDKGTSKYWFNEELLMVDGIDIAELVLNIIDTYVELKSEQFDIFFKECTSIKNSYDEDPEKAIVFIKEQLQPYIDARIFEIVSYCIIKYAYKGKVVYFGRDVDHLEEYPLVLYKTGRTNANDGGIDFIMKPIGRVYQVTEDINFKKYFLDIDKLNKFPITFVIKTALEEAKIKERILESAKKQFKDPEILERYLNCFEGIINILKLNKYLQVAIENGHLGELLDELIIQCKVEYNIADEEEEGDEE